MSKTQLWPSCTGTIVRMEKRQGPKADFVSLTLECVSNDGETSFRRDCIAFDNENDTIMSDLLALGRGARVFVRGPLRTAWRETASGSKFRQSTMTVRTLKEKPLVETADDTTEETVAEDSAPVIETNAPVAEAAVETPSCDIPALPEGATEITHTLYTKRDGAKAWRKRPAAQVAKLLAAQDVAAEDAETAPEEPAAVETVEETVTENPVAETVNKPNVLETACDSNEDTAMAAALKAALAA